ncbi:MAG: hypothetical protein U1E27_01735 [Kiritimatiellia bacterium]|nr:hypothetical protein [Kiritimatiellia bacterium]
MDFRPVNPCSVRFALFLIALALSGCLMGPPRTSDPYSRNRKRSSSSPDLSQRRPWSGWDDVREPAIPFRETRGWTALSPDRQPALWTLVRRPNPKDEFAAQFTFREAVDSLRLSFRPPEPVLLPDPFDALDLWMEWQPEAEDGTNRTIRVVSWIECATGEILRIPVTIPPAKGWHLVHHVMPADFPAPNRFPARFLGFDMEAEPGREGRAFLSGWTPYLRSRIPLASTPPPFRREKAQSFSETGETGPAAPPVRIPPAQLRLPATADTTPLRLEEDRFLTASFGRAGNEVALIWDIHKPLNGVHIRTPWGEPLDWKGVDLSGPTSEYPGSLVFLAKTEEGYQLDYADGLRVRVERTGSALSLDYSDRASGISKVSWPLLAPVPGAKIETERFLSIQRLPAKTPGGVALFLSLAWDPFVSNASTGAEPDPLRRPPALQVRYLPTDRGRRPPLRERFLLSVSESIEGCLPAPSPLRPALLDDRQVLLVLDEEPDPTAEWVNHGLTGVVVIRKFKEDGLSASEGHPLDEDPLRAGWSRDHVVRKPDGSWRDGAAAGTTRSKPDERFRDWALSMTDIPRNGAAGFLLSLPTETLGNWTDYDHRTPRAGSFRGALDSALAGWASASRPGDPPLILEEETGWALAPWADALLLSDRQGLALEADRERREYLFAGLQRHPRPIGIGSFSAWRTAFPDESEESVLHRFIALQLAANVGGRLPEPGSVGVEHQVKAALTFQILKTPTADASGKWTGFQRDGQLQSLSEVWGDGAPKDRLYRQGSRGMELWVNLSRTEDWTFTAGNDIWTLPPAGWTAVGPDIRAFSARMNAHRIDWIETPDWVFYRGPGPDFDFRGFRASGAVLVRRGTSTLFQSTVEVYDYAKSGRVQIRGEEWTGWMARPWECRSETGEILGRAEAVTAGGSIVLKGPPGTLMYRLIPESP